MKKTETLCLTLPDARQAEAIRDFRAEVLAAGSSMDGCGTLKSTEDPLAWMEETERMRRAETCPAGLVPATQFLAMAEGRLVGLLQIRHFLNDYLERFAGHIGYYVRPSERRKGYATEMLRQSLPVCASMGIARVLVCCRSDNEASRRVICANGGVYASTAHEPDRHVDLERYWIALAPP